MTEPAAQISRNDVRRSVELTITHLERAAEQVVWQIENQVWMILGYADWDEMRQVEYQGAAVIVPRADRPQLVSRLRSEGLSQQQIGDTLGVAESTVRGDIRNSADTDAQPGTRTDALGRERPTNYSRPAPKSAPKPEPEPEQSEAVSEFLDSDEDLRRERYLHSFLKTLSRSDDFMQFDAHKLGEIADPDVARTLDDYLTNVRSFVERFHRAQRGLQVIQGGKQ